MEVDLTTGFDWLEVTILSFNSEDHISYWYKTKSLEVAKQVLKVILLVLQVILLVLLTCNESLFNMQLKY